MAGGFAGAARGLGGYYDFRDRRLTAEERDEDRTRELGLRKDFDPIKLRKATLLLDELESNAEFREYLDEAGYRKTAADRGNERGVQEHSEYMAGSGARTRGVDRADRAGEMSMELSEAQQPGLLQDTRDREGFRDQTNRLQRSSMGYQESLYDVNAQLDDEWARYYDLDQQFRNALTIALQSQDPTAIVFAYDKLIPDGQQVEIKELPAQMGPGIAGPPDKNKKRISVITPRTVAQFGPEGAVFDSFDDFLQATQQVFQQHLQMVQPRQGTGISRPGATRDRGYAGGYSGMGGTPAEVNTNEYYMTLLSQTSLADGLNEGEIGMLAMKMRKNAETMAPEVAAREAFFSITEKLITSAGKYSGRVGDEDILEIQAEAAHIVNRIYGDVDWQTGMGDGGRYGGQGGGYDFRDIVNQGVGRGAAGGGGGY